MSKIRGDWESELDSPLDQGTHLWGGTDLMPDGSQKLFVGATYAQAVQYTCELFITMAIQQVQTLLTDTITR